MTEQARQALAVTKAWLVNAALPLWLDRGVDARGGGFHERLDFDAAPITGVPRRLTVQARQIFVYALASERGWIDARDRVTTAFDSMVSRYLRADGSGGWMFSVDGDGAPIDASSDLYATAFLLLACAWHFRLSGDSQAIGLADDALAHMDAAMTAAGGFYVDRVPDPPAALRQNPHMHLFEALLALYEATGEARYRARAEKLHRHFNTALFVKKTAIVAEYFDADWKPRGGANALWEPGHHFEWAWLLGEADRLTGSDSRATADALIETAYRHGVAPDGAIFDELSGDGAILKRSRRSWPLTEAAKANAARLGTDAQAAERLASALLGLQQRHLDTAPLGLWHDHRAEDGRCLVDYVPATTLYHIALAVAVAEDALAPPKRG